MATLIFYQALIMRTRGSILLPFFFFKELKCQKTFPKLFRTVNGNFLFPNKARTYEVNEPMKDELSGDVNKKFNVAVAL